MTVISTNQSEIIWDNTSPAIKLNNPSYFINNLSNALQIRMGMPIAPGRPFVKTLKIDRLKGEYLIQDFPIGDQIKIWLDRSTNCLKFENQTLRSKGVDPMWVNGIKQMGEMGC